MAGLRTAWWALRRWLDALGIAPSRTARALAALPRHLRERRAFAARTDWPLATYPCLLDRDGEAALLGEYFWQDLFVARRIIEAAPRRHIDVGSRIDGFVAHLACVRPVEVFDIRPLAHAIPNVSFRQWDLTAPVPAVAEAGADCVSCLHTLEHVGLGRYGDRLDPDGWRQGLARLASLVLPLGCLWLSVPVGRRRVEFNAHRVFDPAELVAAAAQHGLVLDEFIALDAGGTRGTGIDAQHLARVAAREYALGVFRFVRPAAESAA